MWNIENSFRGLRHRNLAVSIKRGQNGVTTDSPTSAGPRGASNGSNHRTKNFLHKKSNLGN